MIPFFRFTTEERAMMGKQSAPEELFYRFRLEDHVPSDHTLRLREVPAPPRGVERVCALALPS